MYIIEDSSSLISVVTHTIYLFQEKDKHDGAFEIVETIR